MTSIRLGASENIDDGLENASAYVIKLAGDDSTDSGGTACLVGTSSSGRDLKMIATKDKLRVVAMETYKPHIPPDITCAIFLRSSHASDMPLLHVP